MTSVKKTFNNFPEYGEIYIFTNPYQGTTVIRVEIHSKINFIEEFVTKNKEFKLLVFNEAAKLIERKPVRVNTLLRMFKTVKVHDLTWNLYLSACDWFLYASTEDKSRLGLLTNHAGRYVATADCD